MMYQKPQFTNKRRMDILEFYLCQHIGGEKSRGRGTSESKRRRNAREQLNHIAATSSTFRDAKG